MRAGHRPSPSVQGSQSPTPILLGLGVQNAGWGLSSATKMGHTENVCQGHLGLLSRGRCSHSTCSPPQECRPRALGPEQDVPHGCRGGTRDDPRGGLGCCMSEEEEELERAHRGGPVVMWDSGLGTIATKPFARFSAAATTPSRTVRETCNY